jgi:dolichol kinase
LAIFLGYWLLYGFIDVLSLTIVDAVIGRVVVDWCKLRTTESVGLNDNLSVDLLVSYKAPYLYIKTGDLD